MLHSNPCFEHSIQASVFLDWQVISLFSFSNSLSMEFSQPESTNQWVIWLVLYGFCPNEKNLDLSYELFLVNFDQLYLLRAWDCYRSTRNGLHRTQLQQQPLCFYASRGALVSHLPLAHTFGSTAGKLARFHRPTKSSSCCARQSPHLICFPHQFVLFRFTSETFSIKYLMTENN